MDTGRGTRSGRSMSGADPTVMLITMTKNMVMKISVPANVYQRDKANPMVKPKLLEIRGVYRVGYDRFADANGGNGGTPGYDKW